MKLDWKRAGCASIAEWRGFTFVCQWVGKMMVCDVIIRSIDGSIESGVIKEDPSAAEAWCEAWIEQRDRPEWHNVTDWLSWAEWRGWRLCVRPDSVDPSRTQWSSSKNGYRGEFLSIAGPDFPGAKYAVEKWVREQRVSE